MKREFWRHFDFLLFGCVVILSIFGIIMIRSAIAGNEELASYVQRQAIFVGIGIVVMVIVALVDYHYWASLSRPLYIVSLIFLIIIFIIQEARFGAARWLDIGFILIQPSELAKIVIILVLADYFSSQHNKTHDIKWIGQSLLITLGIVIWILLQPNLSTSIVIFVIWFSLLWFSGLPPKYLVFFIIIGILGSIIAFPLLEDYQQQRILDFIIKDPNATYGNTYNVDQALVTIGSGGWFGQGYGQSTQVQLRFLKVRHTDFIFSAMASEFGFIGTVIVLAMLVFVILRCIRAAKLSSDMFGSLIAFGFAVLIFFQAAVNIGVNLNLMPVTGLTLPFVSYGGSSLLSLVLGIGLVESIISRHKSLEF